MGIAEKKVPTYLSIAACIGATAFTGWLWYEGGENPRRFHSNMAINKHNEYSAFLTCYDCHVPRGSTWGFSTALNCLTSGCHGELSPDIGYEEAVALKNEEWGYYPDARERIEHYLDLHMEFAADSCASCHSEHERKPIRVPEGWRRYEELRQAADVPEGMQTRNEWRSLAELRAEPL